MEIFYYKSQSGNFGDDINAWLWRRLLGGRLDHRTDLTFCGIGTIIGQSMPAGGRWVVFSSGVGYGRIPPDIGSDERWDVAAVRGPLSARVLGLDPAVACTDGAILLSALPEYAAPAVPAEPRRPAFMPHHKALPFGQWEKVCALAGVTYLDPREDTHALIEKIRASSVVLADAMHAAIVADAMRVPWIPLASSNQISAFKWTDWTLSLQVPYDPVPIPPSSAMERYRGATQFLYGENYFSPRRDVESLMKQFHARQAGFANPLRKSMIKVHRKLFYTLPRQMLASRPASAANDRHVEAAAALLSKVSAQAGYLSADAVFGARRDELRERLEGVVRRYA